MTAAVANITTSDSVIQLVTFRLQNETYGIDVMQVQEVLRVSEIAPVPGARAYVLGIINLRGQVVTVIDTRRRFGLSPSVVDDASRILIIESENEVVGMLVDSVAEVVELSGYGIDPPPTVVNEENSPYIQGVATRGEELLILVNPNKLLTEEDWEEDENL